MSEIIPYPGADRASNEPEAEREQLLFRWVDMVLAKLGYTKAVAKAASLLELADIAFDLRDPEVTLAIREALHPAAGKRPLHFRGLNDDALRRLLRAGFDRMKRDRDKKLRTGTGSNWENDILLDDKGKIVANLFNLTLILQRPQVAGCACL
jgi:hypothetical protein